MCFSKPAVVCCGAKEKTLVAASGRLRHVKRQEVIHRMEVIIGLSTTSKCMIAGLSEFFCENDSSCEPEG